MVLCLSESDNKFYFGVVQHIFIKNNKIYFICQKIITVFDNHVHAYDVTEFVNEYCIINYESLHDTYPTALIRKNNVHYILY